ncbi:hypothetical protein [Reichenbachiella ulvae]|uniref:GRAM domain-containing protein n=1 Tax=Reichenbachiella ulvae TaxID=2980104 RepID=A0ABT3CND9_9BACT|nr:hypothetical protein [Reichenbachiella ulvae]MCV9385225.1 hypothetical protein [Reichenbachiella ulvae]
MEKNSIDSTRAIKLLILLASAICIMMIVSYISDLKIIEELTFILITTLATLVVIIHHYHNKVENKIIYTKGALILEPDETSLIEGKAISINEDKVTYGVLYLTNNRLIFSQEGLKFFMISLAEIVQVNFFLKKGFLKKGITVLDKNNQEWSFLIEYPEDWISLVHCQIGLLQSSLNDTSSLNAT